MTTNLQDSPRSDMARSRKLTIATVLALVLVGGAGGWLFAQQSLAKERLNRPTDITAAEQKADTNGPPVRVLGRDGGGDVITTGDIRTLSMFFVNFEVGESIVLPAGADIDVGSVVISNGNLLTTEFAVGGIFIQNAQEVPYVFYALDTFGTTAHNFDPPLPLREGDSIVVIPASATTNVEWDITLHGRVPAASLPQPSGVITR